MNSLKYVQIFGICVRSAREVRVAPTGADEPTMDLRKLPLGIEVSDPEAAGFCSKKHGTQHEI